jgi:hypothetical protein
MHQNRESDTIMHVIVNTTNGVDYFAVFDAN